MSAEAVSAPAATEVPSPRFFDRELSWVEFNARVLELAADESVPAAGAAPLHRDLLVEPRRVLPGPRGRDARDRRRPSRCASAGRASRPRASCSTGSARGSPSCSTPSAPCCGARSCRRSPRRASGSSGSRTATPPSGGGSRRRSTARSSRSSPRSRSAPAGRSHTSRTCRCRSAVRRATPRAASGASPGSRCPRCCRASSRSSEGSMRFLPIEQLIAAHLGALFPGMTIEEQATFRVTRDADLEIARTTPTTCCARSRSSSAGAASATSCGSRSTRRSRRRCATCSSTRCDVDRRFVYAPRTPDRPRRPGPARRARPARAALHAVEGRHPAAAAPGPAGRRQRRLRRHARGRHPRPPPLRRVRDLGRAVHRTGGRRPGRGGDQARRSTAPRATRRSCRPDPGRRAGQAGGGAGRAQGPLRRGDQHRLGPGPRAGRRARGLRLRRPEDARQAGADRPPRGRRHAPLRPRRHRQLQPDDGPALHRLRAVHRRRRTSAPTSPTCSTT